MNGQIVGQSETPEYIYFSCWNRVHKRIIETIIRLNDYFSRVFLSSTVVYSIIEALEYIEHVCTNKMMIKVYKMIK